MLSFWEKQTWFTNVDYCIIGSGLVGLSTALNLRALFPKAKILIIERGILPSGASTKNAGFACYGSPSEILDDLQFESENHVFMNVEHRYKGFQQLHSWLGSKKMGYEAHGGYEIFNSDERDVFNDTHANLEYLNDALLPIFKREAFRSMDNLIPSFGFKGINHIIGIPSEGQIDTGKTLYHLSKLAIERDILILNGLEVERFQDSNDGVFIHTEQIEFKVNKLAICTNGFAKKLSPNLDVQPTRAQVLITNPIENLPIKGVFHMYKGYYYFRNVNNRILFGGGRHLAFQDENTDSIEVSGKIQKNLEKTLKNHILPSTKYTIDQSWAGIMGFGTNNNKGVLIEHLSPNTICGVRLGGMGIAIGANVGQQIAEKFL